MGATDRDASSIGNQPPKLLDHVAAKTRLLRYSNRTERPYAEWIERYILLHNKKRPRGGRSGLPVPARCTAAGKKNGRPLGGPPGHPIERNDGPLSLRTGQHVIAPSPKEGPSRRHSPCVLDNVPLIVESWCADDWLQRS
jgi:hypothetical protein